MKPLELNIDLNPDAAIVVEEQTLLARVQSRLSEGGEPEVGIDAYEAQMISLRDQVGEAKPEDVAPLVEQLARMQAIYVQRGRAKTAPVDPASPYFAHMRLVDSPSADVSSVDFKQRDVLIGKRGFIDRKSGIQIVDWRNAPVSRIYYRYEEGDDFEEQFDGGQLAGEVALRRNITTLGGELRRIGCPQGTFTRDVNGEWWAAEGDAKPTLQGGQGKAARPPRPQPKESHTQRGSRPGHGHGGQLGVHSGSRPRADKHLPEIAALIDREQFDLITKPQSGLVLIQGGAGSGKTTVALHRVAFLNFEEPQRFRPNKMLVVVPSEALVRYVADVLPSLGVSGVPVVTYRAWAKTMRRRVVPHAPDLYTDDTPAVVSRMKKHPAVMRLFERHTTQQVARVRLDLVGQIGELEGGSAVIARWDGLEKEAPVWRIRRVATWLERGGPTDSGPLPAQTRAKAEVLVRRHRARLADIVHDWGEVLTDRPALTEAFEREAPGQFRASDIDQLVKWSLALQVERLSADDEDADDSVDIERYAPVDGRPLADGGAEGAAGKLDVEDDPILLRIAQLKYGKFMSGETGKPIDYEHIAIDEAQDLSPIEVKVLLDATTPQRCVTIAGDVAQRLVFDNSFTDWRHLLDDAGLPHVEVSPLKLSYRSTYPVMQFARAVLGPLATEQPIAARDGVPVELHLTGDMGETVGFLAEVLRSLMNREPTASVALLSRYPEQADAYYAALSQAEVPALRRVRRQDFQFKPGIDVTDVAQVKGLEFDYVLLLDVTPSNYPATVEARHLLHIGATRAAHQLWLVASGTESPLVADWQRTMKAAEQS